MEELSIEIKEGSNLFVDGKVYITHYTETLKRLEEEKKVKCITVDNTDFITWYLVKIITKENIEEDIKQIIKEKIY